MEGTFVANRRRLIGLTQQELSALSGVKQPLISAIENGRREATPAVAAALRNALRIRPSVALARRRDEVLVRVQANHGRAVHVFGSVARGEDTPDSDVDLVVQFEEDASLLDLLALEDELQEVLTVPVDVISAGGYGRVTAQANREKVPL
ncbi:MAG: nucleotidyltransferase domain-containing protein [Actinomycetia bacterium]|nr:nucleotidyltransferase domain-containing protein [Actinomycetes bacterium]